MERWSTEVKDPIARKFKIPKFLFVFRNNIHSLFRRCDLAI